MRQQTPDPGEMLRILLTPWGPLAPPLVLLICALAGVLTAWTLPSKDTSLTDVTGRGRPTLYGRFVVILVAVGLQALLLGTYRGSLGLAPITLALVSIVLTVILVILAIADRLAEGWS